MPSCDGNRVRVNVGGQTIPVLECDTWITKDGVSSMNRSSEIIFPLEWDGSDISGKINAFEAGGNGYDLATVEYKSVRGDVWHTVHNGFVRGVGGSDKLGSGKLWVNGLEIQTSAIPASKVFESPSIQDVMNYVADEYSSSTGIDIQVSGATTEEFGVAGEGFFKQKSSAIQERHLDGSYTWTFKKNRHSLKDVMDWLCNRSDQRWYFLPTDPPTLVVESDSSGQRTFVNTHPQIGKGVVSGSIFEKKCGVPSIDIIENTVIRDMFPINTLEVYGETGTSIFGFNVKHVFDNKFPAATATYPPLVEQAGGQKVKPKTVEANAVDLKECGEIPKRKLKKRIQQAGEGEIKAFGRGDVNPYDTLLARPECSDVPGSIPRMEFDIIEVHHKKVSTEQYKTYLTVAPHVDKSKMTVDSRMLEV